MSDHALDTARRTAAGKSSRSRRSSASSAQTFETAASVPAVAVEPAAPLTASTSFAETASVATLAADADTPNRRGSDRSTDASGTPIGEIRDRSERVRSSLRRGRESEASEYSCAYELDLDDLDEGELTVPRLPDPPPEVKHAFRCAARGDVEGLEAALDADPSLLYALNRGGASLVDVASERQRVAVVNLLRARENPARRRLVETESLEAWLAARGLAALTNALADIADDPDDLREMTDDDVVDALEAVADAEERRVADEKLRRALRDLGAQVSPFITTKIPTEFEDDDTVAPWADFTPENQAAKLAELEAFNARIPDASAMPPPPPVARAAPAPAPDASAVAPDAAAAMPPPPRVSQSPGQFRTPPRPPGVPEGFSELGNRTPASDRSNLSPADTTVTPDLSKSPPRKSFVL